MDEYCNSFAKLFRDLIRFAARFDYKIITPVSLKMNIMYEGVVPNTFGSILTARKLSSRILDAFVYIIS